MIGWYVHHAGYGHVSRFLAVLPHLGGPVVAFSSLPRPASAPPELEWVVLPADDDPLTLSDGGTLDPIHAEPAAHGVLHWAPLGHAGHRARLGRIVTAIVERPLDTMVVDVSVEVTALARLLGVRTVVFTQPGDRTDPPHTLAFGLADTIVAPWPEDSVAGTATSRPRVVEVGGISRFDGRPRAPRAARTVAFLGTALPGAVLAATRALLHERGWTTTLLGTDASSRVDDPWPGMSAATVVVSAAGQNSIADLAAADARAVVIPQERPFGEQAQMAATLDRLGLAHVAGRDADAGSLVALIERAAQDTPDWSRWRTVGAAARAAAAIEAVS